MSADASEKIEIVEYLNWISEEQGFKDYTNISRMYCRYLQNGVFDVLEDTEIEVR
jgi:hypothetical protein